jgi:hypothetical protein
MELKMADSPRALQVKYTVAISPLAHRLVGQSVLLTCIVEKRGGDETIEAVDIKLVVSDFLFALFPAAESDVSYRWMSIQQGRVQSCDARLLSRCRG